MRIAFVTQTVGLEIFDSTLTRLKAELPIEEAGFYVANSMYYEDYTAAHPDLEERCTILKEWEIVSAARLADRDISRLEDFEREYGDPTLWNALICDRRIYLGRMCKEVQDYRPSFSHEEMLSLLAEATARIEAFIDGLVPDVILSLDPVTFGDYLFYLIAAKRKIPMLFVRTTKIRNHISLDDCIFGCSKHIRDEYDRYASSAPQDQWTEAAEQYLETTRGGDIRYEGMILIPSKNRALATEGRGWGLKRALCSQIRYTLKHRHDHHIQGQMLPAFYRHLLRPLRKRLTDLRLGRRYVAAEALSEAKYAFYPLQSEPEIAALIWGKPYMNQIEAARTIARSLPVGMKLVVKEHPRALGYRPSGYYRKLLEIPNLLLAHPDQEVRPLIEGAQLVVAIAGFVAFEAVVFKRPALMLGGPRPFTVLPSTMLRYAPDASELDKNISLLLAEHKHDEASLVNYVAAIMRTSAPIDYFTVLLRKRKRHADQKKGMFTQEIDKLAAYTARRIREVLDVR